MDLAFLPSWPFHFNDLLLFSLLLGAGILGGHLAGRTPYLPRISGYIAAGFLLGPGVTGLLSEQLLGNARVFTDIALGLILFELGRLLKLRELFTRPWLVGTSLVDAALSFVLIFVALRLGGVGALNAGIAAAVGVSSSPAVVLLVVRQFNASGPVTDNTLALVALNNVLALSLFLIILPILHFDQQATAWTIVLQPLYHFGMSALIAGGLALVHLWSARRLGTHENVQFALTVGTIVAAIGLSKMLNVSALFTLLALGVLSSNLDREQRLPKVEFGYGGELFFLILFVVAGATLHLEYLGQAGLLAVLFVLARQLAKSSATYLMLRAAGVATQPAALTGLALMPMAGLAIGLSQLTTDLYPQFGRQLETLVLAAVAILETVGPIATEFALKRAGEVPDDGTVHH